MSIPKHILAVATMVMNEKNEILLVRNHTRGWEFPGGYVDEQESIKAAAIREVKEESGIDIQLTRYCGIDQKVAYSTCVVIFEGKAIGGNLSQSNENLEVGFFSIDVAQNMITLSSYRERFLLCLNQKDHPFIHESE